MVVWLKKKVSGQGQSALERFKTTVLYRRVRLNFSPQTYAVCFKQNNFERLRLLKKAGKKTLKLRRHNRKTAISRLNLSLNCKKLLQVKEKFLYYCTFIPDKTTLCKLRSICQMNCFFNLFGWNPTWSVSRVCFNLIGGFAALQFTCAVPYISVKSKSQPFYTMGGDVGSEASIPDTRLWWNSMRFI